MTQGIEKMLGLPSLEEALKEHGIGLDADGQPVLPEDDGEGSTFHMPTPGDNAVSAARKEQDSLEGKDHGAAMDTVFNETLKHARDIVDLGFNIDHARAARLFEVAATMYGQAVDAKNKKRDAQLKALRLALETRKMELEERKFRSDPENTIDQVPGEATVVIEDRNELIKRLRQEIKDNPTID